MPGLVRIRWRSYSPPHTRSWILGNGWCPEGLGERGKDGKEMGGEEERERL